MADQGSSHANAAGQSGEPGGGSPGAVWTSGAAYEAYIGRWSRLLAREFLAWLDVPPQSRWLDVGCGSGALTQTILALAEPQAVTGLDVSAAFVAYMREQTPDPRTRFVVSDARTIGEIADTYDAAVSGLMLNFVPEPERVVAGMMRVTRAGGTLAAYIWDYAGRMEMMRAFWDTASALDPAAADEGPRFSLANAEALRALFASARLADVATQALDLAMRFRDFDDYWAPFLGGTGPAPHYVAALDEQHREALREALHTRLPIAADGSITLAARAWAVRGTR